MLYIKVRFHKNKIRVLNFHDYLNSVLRWQYLKERIELINENTSKRKRLSHLTLNLSTGNARPFNILTRNAEIITSI